MTPEELQKQRELIEQMTRATRTINTIIDNVPATVQLFVKSSFKTRGGYMFDVAVTFEERETQHRVIVGKDYYEDYGIEPETVLDRVFAFLLRKRVPRRTEGATGLGNLPSTLTISFCLPPLALFLMVLPFLEVTGVLCLHAVLNLHWLSSWFETAKMMCSAGMLLSSQFPINYFGISDVEQWFEDFTDEYADTGKVLPGSAKFWRFNRLHDYGDSSSALDDNKAVPT